MAARILSSTWRLLLAHRWLAAMATAAIGLAIGLELRELAQPSSKPPTLPQLIRSLQKRDNPLHEAWQDIWTCLPNWITRYCQFLRPTSAAEVRLTAAQWLGILGPKAQRAVPYLVQAIKDPEPDVSLAALAALEQLGPIAKGAVPGVLAFFTDPGHDLAQFLSRRMKAAGALPAIAPDDAAVQATLLQCALEHRDLDLRAGVITAFGKIKTPPASLIAALTNCLVCPYPVVQYASITALGEAGAGAAAAVPSLVQCYEDLARASPQRPLSATQVSATLRYGMGPRPPPPQPTAVVALPGGINLSSNTIYMVRQGSGFPLSGTSQALILQALGKMGPAAKSALPLLRRESKEAPAFLALNARFAAWQVDQNTDAAVADFTERLDLSHPVAERRAVIDYLGRLGPASVASLCKALQDPQLTVRFAAIQALEPFGPAAQPAAPQLESLRRFDPKHAVRTAAESALGNLRSAATNLETNLDRLAR